MTDLIRTQKRCTALTRVMLVTFAVVAAITSESLSAQTPPQSASQSFDIVPVAPGVYAAIGKNGVFRQRQHSSSARIDVVVVDTQARPSWARDFITEIRKVTDKPVRYVINTHWHGDHTLGNQAYAAAFGPNVTFVAQTNTREDLISRGAPQMETQRTKTVPDAIAALEKQLSDGKDAKGVALTDATRQQTQTQLAAQRALSR